MRFIYVFYVFVTIATALSIKKDLTSELQARDDSASKVQAAKAILSSLHKLKGTEETNDDKENQPADAPAPKPETKPEPKAPVAEKTPSESPNFKTKVMNFLKGKMTALMEKMKGKVKAKAHEKMEKLKGSMVKAPKEEGATVVTKQKSAATTKKEGSKKEVEIVHDKREFALALAEDDFTLDTRGLVDDVMTQVFVALKRSGLIDHIIRMSLTDDEVRSLVASITIELIRADVIPYTEVFTALQESGLALDVVKFSLTDAETRLGLIALVMELVPQLVEICSPIALSQADLSKLTTRSPALEIEAW